MSFGADFFGSIPLWFESLSPSKRKDQERVQFAPEVSQYLRHAIQIVDRQGITIYLLLTRIELMETSLDEQYTFDFEISLEPPAPGYAPRSGSWQPAEIETSVQKYSEQAASKTLYGYVFSSLNSLHQNVANLREFVLSQRDQGAKDEVTYESDE